MATMSAFAMTALGMDSGPARERVVEIASANSAGTSGAAARASSRRATSNFNSFQTSCQPCYDSPPSYSLAIRHNPKTPSQIGHEPLPKYTCTVSYESKLLLQLESINPIHGACETYWRDAYVILRGTLLFIYRLKDNGPGRLLRTYTLQHAEVGLATDTQHDILIPQTRLAHLIPSSARRKAFNKDPGLFKVVKQTIVRLRAETDQFIFADSSEDKIHDFINALSASIDIAVPIDERSIPKQCTVPRRRRRPNPATALAPANLTDPALLAEQERILREMYPAFAERADASAAAQATRAAHLEGLQRPGIVRMESSQSTNLALVPTTTREEDDVDLSMIREETTESSSDARPPMSRNTTASTVGSTQPQNQGTSSTSGTGASLTGPAPTDGSLYTPAPNHITAEGKWCPPHTRTAASIQRYVRRCMPLLPASSPRASDIIICGGRRCRINWRTMTLEAWEMKAPSYAAHNFDSDKKTSEESQEIPSSDHLETETSIGHPGFTTNEESNLTSSIDSEAVAIATIENNSAQTSTTQSMDEQTSRRSSSIRTTTTSDEDEILPIDSVLLPHHSSHGDGELELKKTLSGTSSNLVQVSATIAAKDKRPLLQTKLSDAREVQGEQVSEIHHGVVYSF